MDNPRYVLKFNEAVVERRNVGKLYPVLKGGLVFLVALVALNAIVLGENLLGGMGLSSIVLLIFVFVTMMSQRGKSVDVPSPVELRFYDDYVVLYRERRSYGKNDIRREYNKMNYAEISECKYRKNMDRVNFFGNLQVEWYRYEKDGTLPDKPFSKKTIKDGMFYFRTGLAQEIDFQRVIEENSPIRVVVEGNK